MQDTMGASQEFVKTSLNQLNIINKSASPKRNFNSGINSEMMNMKKKMTALILNVEGLESTVKRLKSEGKNRYAHIEDSVQAEIDTLKLFKDRVEIEVQILKKQYNQTMNSHNFQ
jgi:uncharacterized protein involved in exopolysaccharide biosynthesis